MYVNLTVRTTFMLQFWVIFIPKQTAENNHNCSSVYECHESAWKQHS